MVAGSAAGLMVAASMGNAAGEPPIDSGTYAETDSLVVDVCGREWAVEVLLRMVLTSYPFRAHSGP